MRVSVAMASYNGEKYIEEQLMSILSQISEQDEIIISDDGSTDQTIQLIHGLQKTYPQIKLISGPCQGIVRNFMNAISHCNHEIIFLSDQDDVWCTEKVKKVRGCFEQVQKTDVVLHNAKLLYQDQLQEDRLLKYRKGFTVNLLKSSYWGCCMAFRRSFAQKYFDSETTGIAHDQLIGLLAERAKSACYLDEELIHHRIHGDNKTRKLSIWDKILFRIKVYRDFSKCYEKRR